MSISTFRRFACPSLSRFHRGRKPAEHSRLWLLAAAGLSGAFFLFVSAWGAGRVYSFSSPTYDFGIFSQMFYYMKETGLPMTTLERDGLLSHFSVHVSPVYYLLLPFYCLAPTPALLPVLQAAVLTSAVIPLRKLGKHYGLTECQRALLCAVLLFYPAYAGGTGYDIHENCFLTPALLWLFYAISQRTRPYAGAGIAAAAILTLSVKEDAAVYVAALGLWLAAASLIRRRKHRESRLDTGGLLTGLLLFAAALAWFFAAVSYLSLLGEGAMTGRYSNLTGGETPTLFLLIQTAILHPLKLLAACVQPEKWYFIAMTLLPLLGLPLLTRRYERYLLLIPYILINLLPDYAYQHNIFFQYTFGSAAILIFLALRNLADLPGRRLRTILLAGMALACSLSFFAVVFPKGAAYPAKAAEHSEEYQEIRRILEQIPEDAPVTASSFYTAPLSRRRVLYDLKYTSQAHMLETRYIVLDPSSRKDFQKYASGKKEDGLENLIRLLEEKGYALYAAAGERLLVYRLDWD